MKNKNKKITGTVITSVIPEPSGICYIKKTGNLFVVCDQGGIYEITTSGKLIRKKLYGKKYDLEGITYCSKLNKLLLAREYKDSILIVNIETLEIEREVKINRYFEEVLLLKKCKSHGIEAIEMVGKDIILSNQSYKKWPKSNASVLFKIDTLHNKQAQIIEIYDHGYFDIAGLSYHDGYMYMTSDKFNLLIKYDIKNNKILGEMKLPKSAQEGICFDEQGYFYIANDKGTIIRYNGSDLKFKEPKKGGL